MFKMLRFLFASLCLVLFACQSDKENYYLSPNKQLQFNLEESNLKLYYQVWLKDQLVMDSSFLGLETRSLDFANGLKIINRTSSTNNSTWKTVWGQRSEIPNEYNEFFFECENSKKDKLNIRFRLFNDGLAFRYEIPGTDSLIITDELTEFNFSKDLSAWWTPQDFDSYEHLYTNTLISELTAVNTPITLEGENLYLSIHEAKLENYSGMTLKRVDSLCLEVDLVPWKDGDRVKAQLPLNSPWRTILIDDKISDLAESSMILNLNAPNTIEDVSWIQPMTYIGVWWEMHMGISTWDLSGTHGARTENVKNYIDFASQNNIGGVLVEGWNLGWETWHTDKSIFDFDQPYPDFDIDEIAAYAAKKNVGLIGHHETGGNIIDYENQIDDAFRLYRQKGIKCMKTGYAGEIVPEGEHHHGQYMVQHYRRIVEKAAENKIMLNAHEPIKPTGLSRTYPNMMTREGARGMEWNAWSEGNSPEYTTTLPYTRLLAGPIDYTPGIFNLKFNGYNEGTRVHSTLARQLALMVVLYSPLQMAADMPSNYKENPAFQFVKDFNTDYDKSTLLDGRIGDFTVYARKTKGQDEWFVGAITDENERQLNIPLSFLDDNLTYKMEVYADDEFTDWDKNPTSILIDSFVVSSKEVIKIALSPAGGAAFRFIPTKNSDLKSIKNFNDLADKFIRKYKSVYKYGSVRTVKNKAREANIINTIQFDNQYTKDGFSILIDRKQASIFRKKENWLASDKNDIVLDLEFEKQTKIDSLQLSCLVENISWIFKPENVVLEFNDTKMNFDIHPNETEVIGVKREIITIPLEESITTKKIKISIKPLSEIPNWHSAKGQNAWLFVDEIILK